MSIEAAPGDAMKAFVETTTVHFAELPLAAIEAYVMSGEPPRVGTSELCACSTMAVNPKP